MEERIFAEKRVLVADDERSVREAFKCLLSVDRHKVTEAVDGKHALDLFAKAHYDLVITDYAMPKMGGEELVKAIKRLAPQQPIIMATAHAEHVQARTRTRKLVLSKPFALNELRDMIARALSLQVSTKPIS